MAWEQNPYTVKVSLVADSSLSTQVNSAGTPVFTPQFRFVSLGSTSATITANVTAGSNSVSVTGTTATPAAFAGIVPGALVTAPAGLAGATVVGINIAAGSFTISQAAPGTTASASITLTVQGQPASQPVATAIVAGQTAPGTTAVNAGGTGPKAIGILQNQPVYRTAAGGNLEALAEAEVTLSGISKVVCGLAVTVGQALTIDTSGAVVPVTYPTTGSYASPTSWVYGTALSSGAQGDLIAMAVTASAPSRNA